MCRGCYPESEDGMKAYLRIEDFNDAWPDAQFTFAHIVLGDDNLEDHNIQWCLDHYEEYKPKDLEHGTTIEELEETKRFLEHLLTIPVYERYGLKNEEELNAFFKKKGW